MHMLDGLTYLMGSMKNLERITEASNENDMIHDYCSGLHYALVESGGFLRNGLGPTSDQWIYLNILERAIVVAHSTMGAAEFMSLTRQRVEQLDQLILRMWQLYMKEVRVNLVRMMLKSILQLWTFQSIGNQCKRF